MKAALIGLGMVSGTYGDAFRNTDQVSLKGVYARSEASRTTFLDAFPGPHSYASVAEIAADAEIDFVILTTPPNARRDIVETLARAGKPILMEKPVERTVDAATHLCEICENAGVSLGIVLQHRARPSAVKMQDMIADGHLGALRLVEVAVPWWRDQSYYDEPGRGTFERDGGGVMISQAIHTLDLMLSLTGPVSEVTAMVATSEFHDMEAEDVVSAGLRFASGALGTLFASTAAFPGRAESIRLHFEHASADLESNALTVAHQDGRHETFGATAATGAGADPMAFSSDWHRAIIEDFANAVRTGRAPLVSGRDALEVHRLIEAITKSGQNGAKVVL